MSLRHRLRSASANSRGNSVTSVVGPGRVKTIFEAPTRNIDSRNCRRKQQWFTHPQLLSLLLRRRSSDPSFHTAKTRNGPGAQHGSIPLIAIVVAFRTKSPVTYSEFLILIG